MRPAKCSPSAEPHRKSNTSSNAKAGGSSRNSGGSSCFSNGIQAPLYLSLTGARRGKSLRVSPRRCGRSLRQSRRAGRRCPGRSLRRDCPGTLRHSRRSLRRTCLPGCRRSRPAECSAGGRPARWLWRSWRTGWPGPLGPSPEDGVVQHRGPSHTGPQIPPAVAGVPHSVQDHPQHQQHH